MMVVFLASIVDFGDREGTARKIGYAPHRFCKRFVVVSTQRSGTTSLSNSIVESGAYYISEATNCGANTKFECRVNGNIAQFAMKTWNNLESIALSESLSSSCTVGFSVLADATSGCYVRINPKNNPIKSKMCPASLFAPLFLLGAKVVVLERRDIRSKWFSHERACITGDWGSKNGKTNRTDSFRVATEYLKTHDYCANPFDAYKYHHTQFYNVLRPMCDKSSNCSWHYFDSVAEDPLFAEIVKSI